MSLVNPKLDRTTGWAFGEEFPDPINNFSYLKQTYHQTNPDFSGPITVPVLYDKKQKVIVNNESIEILRILNDEFNKFAKNPNLDLYPENLRAQIDELKGWITSDINRGVYAAKNAKNDEEYEKAKERVFNALDKAEELLSKNKFLTGDNITEADVCLFPTLLRFDPIYYDLFKLNKKRISDYPNLSRFLDDFRKLDGVESTIDMDHIEKLYLKK